MDPLKTPTPPEAKLHFLDYWRIIRIRKTVILAVFLLVVITATIVTFILPEQYSSRARIKVERDSTDVAGVDGRASLSGMYDPYFIQTEFEVIQSERVLDRVIETLNLNEKWQKKYNVESKFKTSESRQALKRMIELRPSRNTSLIDITVYSDDKAEASQIANAIAEVYEDYRQSELEKLTRAGIKAFEKEMDEQDVKVKAKEAEVDELRKTLGVIEMDPQASGPTASLGPMDVIHYNTIKIDAETRFVTEDTMLKKLKDLTKEELAQAIPTAAPDTILGQLLQDKLSTETRLITLRNDYGEENPEVQRVVKFQKQINEQIDARLDGILKGMETRVAADMAVVENATNQVAESKLKDIALAEKSRPYYIAKADLDRLRRFHDVLALRTFQENVEIIMPKNHMVTIIEHAEPSSHPVRPNKPLNIALGIIIGLVVGVGLAFFIEYLDTSVKTIDDVERTLQAAVLGVIPQNVGYLVEEGAESPHAEAYRVLRTNLLFSRKDDKLNTVAVVSAGPGEGKSTTVCNLATVFAQSGQRVLMVDSDLRRPTLHKLMGVTNALGLTNYLLKQNTLEEVIQTSKLPCLDFMASGKLPSSSLGILSSVQMKDLINELKQRYDFVFFDSPPIMGVSDASILASEVDMTLQVIQYRRYPQPMNIRAKQLIEKVGGNLIGIVLNNINMSQDESYYYYSGYYHDYYSKNEDEPAAGSNGATGKHRAWTSKTNIKRQSSPLIQIVSMDNMKFIGRGIGGLAILFAVILLAGCETGGKYQFDPLASANSAQAGTSSGAPGVPMTPDMPPMPAGMPGVPGAPVDPSQTLMHVGDSIGVLFTDIPNQLPAMDDVIKEDGTITLQYDQKFLAAGKTISMLQAEIRDRYVPKYWKYLTVTIRIQDRYYFVGGEVRSPNRQVYTGYMTLTRAIDTAGGFTDYAAKGRIVVTRTDKSKHKVDYSKALNDSSADLPIYPGDRIFVPQALVLMVHFKIVSGKMAGAEKVARHFPFQIGRAAAAGLRLEDDGVWEKHLELTFDPDIGFTLATHPNALAALNGQSFQRAVLRNGDAIEIGALKLRFWLGETRQSGLRFWEWLSWAASGLVVAAQFFLIYRLAR